MRLKVISKTNNEKFRLMAVALSGILSSVAFFYPDLFIIQWFSYIPFFLSIIIEKETPKKLFFYGFLFNFIKSAIVFSMFFQLINLDFGVSKLAMIPLIFIIILSVAAVQSVIFGFVAILTNYIFQKSDYIIVNIVFVSAIFTFSEYTKTLFERIPCFDYFGFPWVMTYITQQNFSIGIQSASIFGAHFITLLIFLTNITLTLLLLKKGEKTILSAKLLLIIFSLNFIYGYISINTNTLSDNIKITIYQDNISSYSKWDSSPAQFCDSFVSDIDQYLSYNNTDFILMSETVFPVTLSSDFKASLTSKHIINQLENLTKRNNIKLICGAFNIDGEDRYNSLFMFDKGKMSRQVYNKRNIVPFGEYIPLENLLIKVLPTNIFNLSGSSLASGNSYTTILSDKAKIGTLICFDSIFDYTASEAVKDGAEIFMLSTNDSWYNDSAATKQHYGHAVFRSIENRRSIARCAATGISGFIDPYGQTISKTAPLQKQIITENCPLRNDITPFVKFGYTYLYLTIILIGLFYVIKFKKQ